MGIIRKLAVRGYRKEADEVNSLLNDAGSTRTAVFLVYGVWIRAMLEIEGNLTTTIDEMGKRNPELHSYPIMLKQLEKWISIFKKADQEEKVLPMLIWTNTLRCILRPELSDIINEMWKIIMRSRSEWNRFLISFRDTDIKSGIEPELVSKTEKHAKAILESLPPKQLSI